MLGRVATFIVPSLAVGITAAVLLGPGATRKAAFVRVYGAPLVGSSTLALRIEAAERLYGIDENAALQGVLVEATEAGVALESVSVAIGPDGVGEALITSPQPLRGPFVLRVRRGKHLLAEGPLDLYPPMQLERVIVAPRTLPGQTSGNLDIHVDVRRGSLAAPFADMLDLWVGLAPHVSPTNASFDGIALEASAPGATIVPEKFATNENGRASFTITPQLHHIELTITAQHPAHGDGKWVGILPVIPGAIWMKPETKDGLEFVSPVPRERIYVSAMNLTGRLFGAIVPVSPDERQEYRGRMVLPDDVKKVATHVIVAGDPAEQGVGTIIWPLHADEEIDVTGPAFSCVLDGASAAEERERGRASRVRRLALLVVITTAIFEVLFMISRSRQAQKKFEENLVGFVEVEPSPHEGEPTAHERRVNILATARQEHPVLRVALAISLVLVAFSMIGALSALQR